MAKLWQKNYTLDTLIETFTVGNDYLLDKELVIADCAASAAHARMLNSIGIITDDEVLSAIAGLRKAAQLADSGKFEIKVEDEDCHTALEGFLTAEAGEVGKKIHTGRSRNDQIQTVLRVWMRSAVLEIRSVLEELVDTLITFAKAHEQTPMPGRTHMQIAMPSSVALWAGSFIEELQDSDAILASVTELLDQCPLGSAASYGVPIPLDRAMTASDLAFSRVQNNVLYANNSRGKFEAVLTDALDYVCLTLSKAAQDLILFSLPEFGYFSLPAELCSGSSIMPQKKNPDGLELMRSRSAVVSSCAYRIKSIIRSLPTGYNRDFQDTKEPLLTAVKTTYQCIRVMDLTFSKLEVNEANLIAACTPELYATDRAIELVLSGKSFRDAYREIGGSIGDVESRDPVAAISDRVAQGTAGNLRLDLAEARSIRQRQETEQHMKDIDEAIGLILGAPMRICRL